MRRLIQAIGGLSQGSRVLLFGGGAVVVLAIAAVAFVLLHKPGNVSHPKLSFTAPTTTPTTTTTTTKPPPKRPPPDHFQWRLYGYNFQRTRDFTGEPNLHPPFRVGWHFGGNALIEFPPVIYGHTLYFMDDGATVKAVNAVTGKQIWAKHLGTLSAASPALDVKHELMFVPTLSTTGSSPGNGEFAAVGMRTGHVIWSRPIAPGTESQPLVSDGTVYFGDQSGTVYALNELTGALRWDYHASAAVKGGVALDDGIVFFGDYSGHVYALNAKTGKTVWAVGTEGTAYGFGSGNFYSTPAVAFGRVYLGNTDGFVYSFAEHTGQLAWRIGTGAYVYASAAVAVTPGLGPTVYMGSYNGDFYAFNAASGAVRWVHTDGDRISGSSTVVNGVVYYSDLDDRRTTGLNARTGAVEFRFHDGAFTPIVADPKTLFLSGYNTLYELIPKTRAR
jgi:outer membrane protein assembly factor BamB